MDPKKKIYLSVTISGAISALLIIFVIFPLLKDIKKNSEDFIFQKNKLISLQKETENFKKIELLYEAYQSNLDKIENLFIDSEFPVEFISFLEENAKKSQLKIEISPLAGKKESEPWTSLFFQVEVSGSSANFLRFLDKLEISSYLIEISNLNIKRLTEKGTQVVSGNISANFSVIVYAK